MQLIANLSLMFTEVPLLERFAAAARAGFDGVEIQFPYEFEADVLRRAAGDTPVILINVPATDARGLHGRASDPDARGVFADGVDQARRYAEILGVRTVNVLSGPPPPGQPDGVTSAVLAENVRHVADRMGALGVTTVVEAVNATDAPGFWLDRLDKALAFLDGLGDDRVRFQFDLYHMARTESDLVDAIGRAGPRIGHVQFADHPGRHEPGTGEIDFAAAFSALRQTGYRGPVSAEYRPAGLTGEGLGWMDRLRADLDERSR